MLGYILIPLMFIALGVLIVQALLPLALAVAFPVAVALTVAYLAWGAHMAIRGARAGRSFYAWLHGPAA